MFALGVLTLYHILILGVTAYAVLHALRILSRRIILCLFLLRSVYNTTPRIVVICSLFILGILQMRAEGSQVPSLASSSDVWVSCMLRYRLETALDSFSPTWINQIAIEANIFRFFIELSDHLFLVDCVSKKMSTPHLVKREVY